jgi:uncharacterized protein YdiU (UPF0061 family)
MEKQNQKIEAEKARRKEREQMDNILQTFKTDMNEKLTKATMDLEEINNQKLDSDEEYLTNLVGNETEETNFKQNQAFYNKLLRDTSRSISPEVTPNSENPKDETKNHGISILKELITDITKVNNFKEIVKEVISKKESIRTNQSIIHRILNKISQKGKINFLNY